MQSYNVRELLHLTKEQIWALPDLENVELIMDDGPLVVDTRFIIFSWYCWEFHRRFPIPLLKQNVFHGKRFTGSVHNELLESGLYAVVDKCVESNLPFDMEDLSLIAMQQTNHIHNDFYNNVGDYVVMVNAFDYVDIAAHPAIVEARSKLQPTPNSIDFIYNECKNILLNSEDLVTNPVIRAIRADLLSMGQMLQCFVARGFLTDIDSHIFNYPVLGNYVSGLTTLYELFVESRSASKALSMQKGPVADTEYTNRKIQLGASNLSNLHYGDCGSTNYETIHLNASNFVNFLGKYRLDETENKLKPIRVTDRSLIGQNVKIRTVSHCKHSDHNGVCSTCLGEIAFQIPKDTNLGYTMGSVFCMIVTQMVLSTKHLDGSSQDELIELSDYDKQFINEGADPNTLNLSSGLENFQVKLKFSADEAPRLSDIRLVETVRQIPNVYKISELTDVTMVLTDETGTYEVSVPVSSGSKKSSFSYDFLNYLKLVGWNVNSRNQYEVDMAAWDLSNPFVVFPKKQLNMVEFMKQIELFIKASKKTKDRSHIKNLRDFDNPFEGTLALYDLVTTKLSKVNIALLEVIVASTMIRSSENRDYRLPSNREEAEIGCYQDNMKYRSLSQALAFEDQGPTFFDIRSFTLENRSDHPLDQVLMGELE